MYLFSRSGIEQGSPALQVDSLPAEIPGKHMEGNILHQIYFIKEIMSTMFTDIIFNTFSEKYLLFYFFVDTQEHFGLPWWLS